MWLGVGGFELGPGLAGEGDEEESAEDGCRGEEDHDSYGGVHAGERARGVGGRAVEMDCCHGGVVHTAHGGAHDGAL